MMYTLATKRGVDKSRTGKAGESWKGSGKSTVG